ncbi:hypothetical protein DHEL01_v204272 [Diaporthe helianthi]|uniref:IBR domain-containing protein n=1 Tax=Diaporthe helianthi TaxID=158607 RepID=A0A2P5I498_DIAHE|nr:hypothetical protein DHEL01_v204272 [Diaporthe helianthi]
MCNRPLAIQEIEEYADSSTFKTYLSHVIDRTVKDMPDFTRCPNPACDSGQVHEGGDAHPFVTCAACNTQFCFRHGIPTQPRQQQAPSQHENMSCDEYDRYLEDPINFRSDHQRQQERAAVERREEQAVARARERMEVILEGRQRRQAAENNSILEQRQWRQDSARQAREEYARLEARRYEEECERAGRERRARAEDILRRKVEDENSERLIQVSTKACPRAGLCT